MDTPEDKALYIWIHGDPYRAPEVYTMAAPTKELLEFRDRYVDSSRDYLLIRVVQVCDQPTKVDQTCRGQRYHLVLSPIEEKPVPTRGPAPEVDLAHTPDVQATAGISLTVIKGVGRRYAALLHEKANIDSVQSLLAAGAAPEGRDQLQSQTGLSPKVLLRWVQLADLMRIEGVGSDYSQLLWEAGITSVPDLAIQDPETLLERLTQAKEEQGGVRRLPYLDQVTGWIKQASDMQPAVSS